MISIKLRLFILSLALGILFISPQLSFKYPSLLDITETCDLGRDAMTFRMELSLRESERFRPFYHLSRFLMDSLLHNKLDKLRVYFLLYGIILGITLFLSQTHISLSSLLLTVAIVFISPISIDTYWRLGTAENFLALFLILSIFLSTRNTLLYSTAFLFFLLSKETAILLSPVFIVFLFLRRDITKTLVSLIYVALILPAILSTLKYTQVTNNYTSRFKINFYGNISTFFDYIQQYPIIFILFIAATTIFLLRKKIIDDWLLPALFVGYMMVISLFVYVQSYYLFPVLVIGAMFFVRELQYIDKLKAKIIIMVMLVAVFLPHNLTDVGNEIIFWQKDYLGDNRLISYILENKKKYRYVFDKQYRPEYMNALEQLSILINSRRSDPGKIISLEETIGIYPTYFCGNSLFVKKYCKWKETVLSKH